MKTKVTFEFNSIEEAHKFLATQGGGQVATTTVAVPEVTGNVVDLSDLTKLTNKKLKDLCAEKGLPYSSSAKKQDLIDLLEGRVPASATAPAAAPIDVPVPPVVEQPPLAVPPAQTTPVAEAAPVVGAPPVATPVAPAPPAPPAQEAAPQVDPQIQPLVDQYLQVFDNAMKSGVQEATLATITQQQLIAHGLQADTRLSTLPAQTLHSIVTNFITHVNYQMSQGAQAPINAGV